MTREEARSAVAIGELEQLLRRAPRTGYRVADVDVRRERGDELDSGRRRRACSERPIEDAVPFLRQALRQEIVQVIGGGGRQVEGMQPCAVFAGCGITVAAGQEDAHGLS